jgi:hypothetical protein
MYSPNPTAISDKAEELLEAYFADDDYLIDALIDALPFVRAVRSAKLSDKLDALHDLEMALQKSAKAHKDFMQDAEDALVAEQGYVKRVDVDDFKFVVNDTRY